MSLLCALGRHRPAGVPRWNDGFYFAKCERCGCDLVRTAFERWHVPRGYRVVWSDRPPASRPDVAIVAEANAPAPAATPPTGFGSGSDAASAPAVAAPEPAAASSSPQLSAQPPAPPASEPPATDDRAEAEAPVSPPGSTNGRLPIQDVLEQLNAEDTAGPAREAPPMPAQTPPRRRSTWDFMDDDPLGDDPPSGVSRPHPAQSAAGTGSPAPVDPHKVAAAPQRVGGLPELWRRARAAVRNFTSGPAEPRPSVVIGLAFLLAVAVAAGMALYWESTSERLPAESDGGGDVAPGAENAGATDPFSAGAPDGPTGEAGSAGYRDEAAGAPASAQRAYVAASLLSCRAAPVLQARRVRNLGRGDEVRVLGYDGEWASLAYRGGQCWARARFLSPVPPL